ncbi:unnamed protein product, partial [Larinioides sclopetarius]
FNLLIKSAIVSSKLLVINYKIIIFIHVINNIHLKIFKQV